MPTISQFFGIVIQMFWREHAPPHFHALYAEHEALIDIQTLDTIGGKLPRRAMALVLEWAALHRDRTIMIPPTLDFAAVAGLSAESVERLQKSRPETIDQASRIAGITPAALASLHVASVRRAA